MEKSHQQQLFTEATTDWLSSVPTYFLADGAGHSQSAGELVRKATDVVIHPEGLYNYLEFGYSVFSQTPVTQLRFMPPSAKLRRTVDGRYECEIGKDPFDQIDQYQLREHDIIELVREKVQRWERGLPADQEIVLPLSGGFDSRLLLWCLEDKSRVRAYTYGGSADQQKAEDVVFARALAEKFKVRWEHVPLGDFNDYIDDWIHEFGPSTHAHGMYHFEFFSRIRERLEGRHALLSGIFGDVWAGSISPIKNITKSRLSLLGYSHGVNADCNAVSLPVEQGLREDFWRRNSQRLEDHRYQIVTTIRLKMLLISYLLRLPKLFNLEPWSPFLEPDVALSMLSLPQHRRTNRLWQREFFEREGLYPERQRLRSDRSNTLNLDALHRKSLEPLDVKRLSECIDPSYVEWVNQNIKLGRVGYLRGRAAAVPKLGTALKHLGLAPSTISAYSAYCCLKPIELLMPSKQL